MVLFPGSLISLNSSNLMVPPEQRTSGAVRDYRCNAFLNKYLCSGGFLFRQKTSARIIRDPHFGVARSFHGRSRTGLGRLRHERLVCVGGGTNVFDRAGRLSKPCPTGLDPSRLRQSTTGSRVAVRSISGKRARAGVGRRPAPRISSRAAGTVSCPMVPGRVGAIIKGGTILQILRPPPSLSTLPSSPPPFFALCCLHVYTPPTQET